MTDETLDTTDFFGSPVASSGPSWKMFSISNAPDATNVYRIAPPVKSLKSYGRWMVYDAIHYGYTINANGKPKHKPFRCIERKNRQTKMLEQDCPECTRLATLRQELEVQRLKKLESGATPEEVAAYMEGASKIMGEFNLDKKWYVLAKNLAGEWGILKIPVSLKPTLDKVVADYMAQNDGMHPLDAKTGVWFEFGRKGKGRQTEYYVEIAKENLGRGQFRYKEGALTEVDAAAINKCPDLATFNDNKILDYHQIQALVEGGGNPDVTAAVFGQPSLSRPQASPPRQPPPAVVVTKPVVTEVIPGVIDEAPVTTSAVTAVAPAMSAEAMMAQIQALQAQLAASQAPKVAPTPEPKAAPKPVAAMTTADLTKMDPAALLAMFPDPNKK